MKAGEFIARHGRRGRSAALLIVMGSLVFISALLIAFLSSVSTERQSANYHVTGSTARLLANSSVDIVMGQIQDATRGLDASGNPLAWASQPGMIRTYNVQGQADGYYKLYSWAGMAGAGTFDPTKASEVPPATWAASPGLYTDLNEPVSGVYPIVDPAATNTVQGFSITNAPVSTVGPASSANAAPMPVQWLYVLKDGTLASPTGTGTSVTVSGASSGNPIVGRVAFWTDDDSCKINVNTAAGDVWTDYTKDPLAGTPGNPGAFWDTPRTGSPFEQTYLAMNQPARNEFQRYPGHPATTYLTAVFTNLTESQLYSIVPRVNGGGSVGGTVPITTSATKPIVQKTDRLYASVGELLAKTNRAVNVPLSNAMIRTAPFFLTANSRSPEVNLFSRPRITVWPVNATNAPAYRTPYDSLIAFCSTLNSNAFYFQRSNSMSPTVDLPAAAASSGVGRNRALLSYLQNLTGQPVPGFSQNGETLLSKYPQDRDQIFTEIFDYVRTLNMQDVSTATMPNSFTPTTNRVVTSGNLPAQSGQVTPIYDAVTKTRGLGRFPTVSEVDLLIYGIGQTTATSTNTQLLTAYPPQSTTNWIPFAANNPTLTNAPSGMTRIQAVLLINLYNPSVGYSSSMHSFFLGTSGLDGFQWKDNAIGSAYPMGFPASATNHVFSSYSQFGGNMGVYNATSADNIVDLPDGGNCNMYRNYTYSMNYAGYPYYSKTLDVTTGGVLSCSGGTVTVYFYPPDTNKGLQFNAGPTQGPIQAVNVSFPSFLCPVPLIAPQVAFTTPSPNTFDYRNFASRLSRWDTTDQQKSWITSQDVVRSMVLDSNQADPRMIAGMTNVPSKFFIPGPNYSVQAVMRGHGIVDQGHAPLFDATLGALVPSVSYSTNSAFTGPTVTTNGVTITSINAATGQPLSTSGSYGIKVYAAIPSVFVAGANGAVGASGVFAGGGTSTVPGDWDTGPAAQADGAFINKADEGDILNSGTTPPYFTGATSSTYLVSSNFFSPNRQMPSAAMFGSLPTGVGSQKPWQTLLFRPDPGGSPQHIGAQSPPDHLFLDLFTMPVVEPYAISDVFSTAGKINMNYQIVPFTYITRSTGVQAVLKSELMLAIPTSDGPTYKTNAAANRRYFIDLAETLKGFTQRFAAHDIFRSASEICTLWLVPYIKGLGLTYSGMQAFWSKTGGSDNGALTGDNIRERPYANLYPRLTTKSNTYTVHYRVQTLKKAPATGAGQWVEGTDAVTGEYRGSSTIERYLDASDATIPDYATATRPKPIDTYYKFRVLESREFRP